jgi:hypothetical protein
MPNPFEESIRTDRKQDAAKTPKSAMGVTYFKISHILVRLCPIPLVPVQEKTKCPIMPIKAPMVPEYRQEHFVFIVISFEH